MFFHALFHPGKIFVLPLFPADHHLTDADEGIFDGIVFIYIFHDGVSQQIKILHPLCQKTDIDRQFLGQKGCPLAVSEHRQYRFI